MNFNRVGMRSNYLSPRYRAYWIFLSSLIIYIFLFCQYTHINKDWSLFTFCFFSTFWRFLIFIFFAYSLFDRCFLFFRSWLFFYFTFWKFWLFILLFNILLCQFLWSINFRRLLLFNLLFFNWFLCNLWLLDNNIYYLLFLISLLQLLLIINNFSIYFFFFLFNQLLLLLLFFLKIR